MVVLNDLFHWMREAIREAETGALSGEVPVGAIVLSADGRVLAQNHNRPISRCDPTAHAEILALREAGARIQNYRLAGSTLVTTVEPCLMCMGAIIHARVSRLVFGTQDPKGGAAGSIYDLPRDPRLNHRMEVVSGILEAECRAMMVSFFEKRRENRE